MASMFITAPLCKVKIHPNIVFQTPSKHFSLIRSVMGFIRVSDCGLWGNVSCSHLHLWGLSRAKQCRNGILPSYRKILQSEMIDVYTSWIFISQKMHSPKQPLDWKWVFRVTVLMAIWVHCRWSWRPFVCYVRNGPGFHNFFPFKSVFHYLVYILTHLS